MLVKHKGACSVCSVLFLCTAAAWKDCCQSQAVHTLYSHPRVFNSLVSEFQSQFDSEKHVWFLFYPPLPRTGNAEKQWRGGRCRKWEFKPIQSVVPTKHVRNPEWGSKTQPLCNFKYIWEVGAGFSCAALLWGKSSALNIAVICRWDRKFKFYTQIRIVLWIALYVNANMCNKQVHPGISSFYYYFFYLWFQTQAALMKTLTC